MKKKLLVALISIYSISASAYTVFDPTVKATLWAINTNITTQTGVIQANHVALELLLREVASSLSFRIAQTTAMVEATAKNKIKFDIEMQRRLEKQKLKKVKQVQSVGESKDLPICSESASVGANEVSNGASSAKSKVSPGGGGKGSFGDANIEKAVESPADHSENDANLSAVISAKYCDEITFAAFGGTDLCQAVNNDMPGADNRLDTILTGARPNGAAETKTFNDEQVEAAKMYVKNTARPAIAPMLKKGQIDSSQGTEYVGMFNQFRAISNAAAEPMETSIANRIPLDETKPLIAELKKSPSAATYFDKTASPEAKRTQTMSKVEFESFEVGRRYANLEYAKDLQHMEEANLTREQIRIASLQNYLLLGIKQKMEKNNILVGQLLASQARQEYEPKLSTLYSKVSANLGG